MERQVHSRQGEQQSAQARRPEARRHIVGEGAEEGTEGLGVRCVYGGAREALEGFRLMRDEFADLNGEGQVEERFIRSFNRCTRVSLVA